MPRLLPGHAVAFAELGHSVGSAYAVGRRQLRGNTYWYPNPNGPVALVLTLRRGKVALAETTSPQVVLYGRKLGDGYDAFASTLRHAGWHIFICQGGQRAATYSRSGTSTLVRWHNHRIFVALGLSSLVPGPCATTQPANRGRIARLRVTAGNLGG